MIENVYPLSPLQEGIYYHWLAAPDAPVYFDQMSYAIEGKLDIDKLEAAYQKLVARHAILRTFFTQEFGDKALQVVRTDIPGNFIYRDCSAIPNFNKDDYKAADRAKGFNLESGSQMRLTVLGMGNDTYEFIWSFHHILMDGWCVGVLVKEFFQYYTALLNGIDLVMDRVYPYASYIEWLGGIDEEESMAYWKNYLSGYEAPCSLPRLNPSIGLPYRLQEYLVALPPNDRQSMQALCAELGITENTFMQVAWGILLARYNNTGDVVFGTVVSGRPAEVEGVESIIGLFINTIPVRVQSSDTATVRELLLVQHRASIDGTNHHYAQLAQIQAACMPGQELFDHILVFENYPVQQMLAEEMGSGPAQSPGTGGGLQLLGSSSIEQTNYDFNLILLPGEHFTCKFSFNASEYEPAFIEQVGHHLLCVIHQMVAHPNIALHAIDLLSEAEKTQLTETFNHTAVDYPAGQSIAAVFEAQAALTPDKTALIGEGVAFTYRQLNELCNQAAHYLRAEQGVQPDDRVALLLQRNHWQIVAILSILKAGGAYVPIDTDYPKERIDFMLSDSGCKWVIDDAVLGQLLPQLGAWPLNNATPVCHAGNLAYIMYTSGSTGRPKGVLVQQGGVVRLVKPLRYMGFTGNEVLLSTAAIGFDVTTFEFWSMLLNGGTLVMCGKEVLLDTGLLTETMRRHQVNTMFFTSGWLNQLVDSDLDLFEGLRTIKVGGERLSPPHIFALKQRYPNLVVVNGYGPTENTGCSCSYTVQTPMPDIPIGKPIDNSTAWIVDDQLRLVPIGVTGELCVGGEGLARGYLNNPELTAQKFIDNPFKPGTKMYKTGDMARWLPDGNITFLGRKDGQVKIRGFRIELGEIENVLCQHPLIESTAIVAKTNENGEKELMAYITAKEAMTDVTPLRTYLAALLPHYMLPAAFVQLPELPLNAHGKVDRNQLLHRGGLGIGTGVAYVAPRNETEEKLVTIWQEVLVREKISIKDNFFAIGGHSLKATRVMSNIRKAFNINLPLTLFFANPTIEQLAGEIEKTLWANNELFDIEDTDRLSL